MPFLTVDGTPIPVFVGSWEERVERIEDQARTSSGALRVARLGADKRVFRFVTPLVDYATGSGYITVCNNKQVVVNGDCINNVATNFWARAWRENRVMQASTAGVMQNNAGPIFIELVEI